MILVENAVISDDIKEQLFVCDLTKCKGACCVEGDLGAPLEEDELQQIDSILDEVKPFMSDAGVKAIEKSGAYLLDEEGDFSTTTINNKECAFAIYDERGILKCATEQAWLAGKTKWRKPISCHLYPIRISKYDNYDALNYHRWQICAPACDHGKELGVPVYKFLKEALIRKYGEAWYQQLVEEIEG
ncbi:DUF3109 family protein [uncultured Imperialibacter sp.]|uniref:DUF3109 family protein n=1 Tax=uncultured Imperialibacter sp. TaxID=1672639 RepID=UPI0030D716C1|tara:strand:- start:21733 stop:22293 length:561 start_codon:yes stop_codon:yes gene_type:complete